MSEIYLKALIYLMFRWPHFIHLEIVLEISFYYELFICIFPCHIVIFSTSEFLITVKVVIFAVVI